MSCGTKPVTPAGLKCIALLAEGLTAKEIGVRLGISRRTVNNQLMINYPRIGVNKDTAAVAWYVRNIEIKGGTK